MYVSDYFVLILKFYTVPVQSQDTRNVVNHKALSSKHVLIFLSQKYEVISQFCHSYVKGPFLMTQLK